jgi:acyl-ACP thioesterase
MPVTLTALDVDFTERWRPSAILTAMEKCATEHAELLGYGRDALLSRQLIWVMSRTHVRMDRYPVLNDQVLLRTWAYPPNRFFYPRCHVFETPQGEWLGAASTLWLAIDLAARQVVAPARAALPSPPDVSDIALPLPVPDRVTRLPGPADETVRLPVYSDLDVNGHVNNARYVDWLCDSLPLHVHKARAIHNLLINYTKEILPSTPVRCTLCLQENAFSMLGEARDGGQVFFEAGGDLMPCAQTHPGL